MSYIVDKPILWNESKNDWLKKSRGVGFEEITVRLAGEDLLDILDHPNSRRYPGQRIFVVRVGEQVLAVPFAENDEVAER